MPVSPEMRKRAEEIMQEDLSTRDESWKGRKVPFQVKRQWLEEAKALVEIANEEFDTCSTLLNKSLAHANRAGRALEKAMQGRVPHRKKRKFINKHFDGSYETACAYRRVARNWNDPRLWDVQTGKMTVDSIEGLLKVLRGETKLPVPDPKKLDELRACVRRMFSKKIRTLDPQELQVLSDIYLKPDDDWFEVYMTTDQSNAVDDVWEKAYKRLKQIVEMVLEVDYYGELAAIRKVARGKGVRRRKAKP